MRVASRVPSLQVYAFLIIIYSVYLLLAFLSVASLLIKSAAPFAHTGSAFSLGPVILLASALSILNIVVGIYLLIARNIKTVSALLTVLLIIGGIHIVNSTVNLVRYVDHVTAGSIVSLFISAALLMYLWNVKSQVDAASV